MQVRELVLSSITSTKVSWHLQFELPASDFIFSSHLLHASEPSSLLNLPISHSKQCGDAIPLNEPALQARHCTLSTVAYFPALQAAQYEDPSELV